MYESMMLFESLVHSEWFRHKPVILFLNKIDLFREKIALSPVSAHFPDYRGSDTDFDAAAKYFADRFRGINRIVGREIYIHFTNATDTTLLKVTMQSVYDMMVQSNLHNYILSYVSPMPYIPFSIHLSTWRLMIVAVDGWYSDS
jgi:guanine nucleotide-binding protein subunit alpha, other